MFQTRMFVLRDLGSGPNSGLAAAKLWLGSCQTRAWQLPNSGLAAAKLWFGVWQLPSQSCKITLILGFSYNINDKPPQIYKHGES